MVFIFLYIFLVNIYNNKCNPILVKILNISMFWVGLFLFVFFL